MPRSRSHCGIANGDCRRARRAEDQPTHRPAPRGRPPENRAKAGRRSDGSPSSKRFAGSGRRSSMRASTYSTISLCCGAKSGSPRQRSGPKWIAGTHCLGWRRSCPRKSGRARRPPPSTSEEGCRMLRDALGVSVSVERLG